MREEIKNRFSITAVYQTIFFISLTGIILVIIDFGFNQSAFAQKLINGFLLFVLSAGFTSSIIRYIYKPLKIKVKVLLFDGASILFIGLIIAAHFVSNDQYYLLSTLHHDIWIRVAILLIFVR
ncbi:MAG: hypothetical protein COZ08_06510, partial [Bacteroidetes bacterium CG_4_10_14_3_um_filter_42_6]